MKKFLLHSSFFILPFLILYGLNRTLYNPTEGDLARIGYIYSNPYPKSELRKQYPLAKKYTLLSENHLNDSATYDVINIGDSFSDQDSVSYPNFLAAKGLRVLNIDKAVSRNLKQFNSAENPIQTLVELLNSNFFDYHKADYIILQSIERHLHQRIDEVDFSKSLSFTTISNRLKAKENTDTYNPPQFFSDATLKIPISNLQYLFTEKPTFSKTYKFKTSQQALFTHNPVNLLCYQEDLKKMPTKNDSLVTLKSIGVLEEISALAAAKNMKLIVLVSPDKYDLYYPYLSGKSSLPKPLFFPYFENVPKKYIDVKSFALLAKALVDKKDIYYYDDSHWSPVGAELIADELYSKLD